MNIIQFSVKQNTFRILIVIYMIVIMFVIPMSVNSQSWGDGMNLSGPRMGLTYITGETATVLKEDYDAIPLVTQFGWQFEWRFFSVEDGPTGVVEMVPAIGGVEQGLFLPTLSVLMGLRSPKGLEFGMGPNLSIAGASIVIAAGVTKQVGQLNIPLNIAVVPSKKGARFTILFGFNIAR